METHNLPLILVFLPTRQFDKHPLSDINECEQDENTCNDTGECVNMIGFYFCKCFDGFQGNETKSDGTKNPAGFFHDLVTQIKSLLTTLT